MSEWQSSGKRRANLYLLHRPDLNNNTTRDEGNAWTSEILSRTKRSRTGIAKQ